MSEHVKPNFWAILPAPVRYDKNCCSGAKLLFAEITALVQIGGECFASNAYFAKNFEVKPNTISVWIGELEKAGHIKSEIDKARGNRRTIHVLTCISGGAITENRDSPITKNREHSNTAVNKKREQEFDPVKYIIGKLVEIAGTLDCWTTSALEIAITNFALSRAQRRKPLTRIGCDMIVTKAVGMGREAATVAFNNSAENNWSTIYPPKADFSSRQENRQPRKDRSAKAKGYNLPPVRQ